MLRKSLSDVRKCGRFFFDVAAYSVYFVPKPKNMEDNKLFVVEATDVERAAFFKKTYLHVAGAVLAFILVETILLNVISDEAMAAFFGLGRGAWLGFIGLFWLGSFVSERMSVSASRQTQYLGLALYVLIEALIFVPLIYVAMVYAGPQVIGQAATVTLLMFSGLTAVVFTTNADFSFLRTGIIVGGFIALGLVIAGAIFGFDLGLWFSVGMCVLASAAILYQTSQIKDHYTTDMYVGAALQLFSSVMLLFWYVLRIFLSRRN